MKLLSIRSFLVIMSFLSISACCDSCGDDGDNGPPYIKFRVYDTNFNNEDITTIHPKDSILFYESDNSTEMRKNFEQGDFLLYLFDGEVQDNGTTKNTFYMHLPGGDIDTLVATVIEVFPAGKYTTPLYGTESVLFNDSLYSEAETFELYKQ